MPVSEYTPVVADVARFIRARTKTQGGAEAGTFNPVAEWDTDSGLGTRPTAEQVLDAIVDETADLANIIGIDIPEKYRDAARNVVALDVALFIELTYYPEQVNSNRSPYAQLKELYDEKLANLLTSMGISTDESDGGAVPVDAGYPSYGGFPLTGIGMEQPW